MRMKFKPLMRGVMRFGKKNAPAILTGIGAGLAVYTTVEAVKATTKAVKVIEEEKKEVAKEMLASDPEVNSVPLDTMVLSKKRIFQLTWRIYLKTVLGLALTLVCVIGGQRVSLKRNAALGAACTLAEKALEEYQDTVKEIVPKETIKEVDSRVAEKRLKSITEEPMTAQEYVQYTGHGNTKLCMMITNTMFTGSIGWLDRCVNKINGEMIDGIAFDREGNPVGNLEGTVMLMNDLYSELGLHDTGIGDVIGWNAKHRIKYYTQLIDGPNGEEVVGIFFDEDGSAPRREYVDPCGLYDIY